MNCEELRIQKNRAYIDYEREADTTQKMIKLAIYRNLKAQYEEAYRIEVLGDRSIDRDGTEGMTEEARETFLLSSAK